MTKTILPALLALAMTTGAANMAANATTVTANKRICAPSVAKQWDRAQRAPAHQTSRNSLDNCDWGYRPGR